MPEKRYCIICGEEIHSNDPEVVFCPEHGGPVQDEPSVTQSLETTWEADEKDSQLLTDITAEWQTGQILLDTYEMVGKLGEGGMGLVYRVHHKSWNMDLAVKQPKAALFTTQKGKEGFIREAETWVDLGLHPHITSCYYVRTIEDIPHIFVEFMEGGSLEDWIQQKKHDLYEGGPETSLERILDIAIQFAWGLAYAHEQGLVHQDVKPLNVLMTPDRVVKVTDFGLAKARAKAGESASDKDKRALVSGSLHTVAYRSPEQAKGEMLSHKTDIWSWAVSVLEMFEGGVYWYDGQSAGISFETYLKREIEGDLPSMPEGLIDILHQCFQKDPDNRPGDMQEIANKLTAIYGSNIGINYSRQKPDPAELKADSLNNKALSILDLGKTDQVESCWESALQADSFHLQSTYNYGVWQWRHARLTDEALLGNLERSGSAQPGTATPLYLRSLVHLERGDYINSYQLMQKAVEISPNETNFQDALSKLNEREGTACLHSLETGPVTSMAVSRDGRTLVTACQASQLMIWDLVKKTRKATSKGFIDAELPVVSTSSNGRFIVEGGFESLRVWDRKEGISRSFDIFKITPRSLAISPDDKKLVCGFDDGSVILYDLNSQEFLDELPYHRAEARSVIFSPDGRHIISGGDYGKIYVYSVEQLSTMAELEGPSVWSLAASWKGEEIFAACRDGNIYHWNTKQKKLIRKFIGHQEEVRSVSVSSDGHLLLSGSYDATVRIWDAHSGRCLYTTNEHEGSVTGVWLQWEEMKGYRAVTASKVDGVRIWQITDKYPQVCNPVLSRPSGSHDVISQARHVNELKQKIRDLLLDSKSARARDLLVAARQIPGFENDVQLMGLSFKIVNRIGRYSGFLGAQKLKSIKDHVDITDQLAVTPDGQYLLSDAHGITVWDLQSKSYKCTIPTIPGSIYVIGVKPIIISPNGQFLVRFKNTEKINLPQYTQVGIWDLETSQWIQTLNHKGRIVDFRFQPDGNHLITLQRKEDDSPCQLSVWDLKTNEEVHTVPCGLDAEQIQITKNGKFILAANKFDYNGCGVSIISLDKGHQKHLISDFGAPFVISPDCNLAAVVGRSGMVLFDLVTGRELRLLKDMHTDYSRSTFFTFSHDGRFFLGPYRHGVGVWSVSTGNIENFLEVPEWERPRWEMISNNISCIQLGCKDGWLFAANNCDLDRAEIALWHINSSKPAHVFKGLGTTFSMGIFNQDQYLIAPREDQYLMWQLDWEHEFPELTDWDDQAKGYLDVFLGQMGGKESWRELSKSDPAKTKKHFSGLMVQLRQRGLGWLREEGVRVKLEEMAAERGSDA